MPEDIFELALNNAAALTENFQSLRSSLSDPSLIEFDAFCDVVRLHSRIAINMRHSGINFFFHKGRHYNVYELARVKSAETGAPVEEILKGRLGKYYNLRTTFDSHFVKSQEFRYGALNIGNAGTGRYGEFCLVLEKQYLEIEDLAHLKNDSLNSYFAGMILNERLLYTDLAPNSLAYMLAAVKHVKEACKGDRPKWSHLTCNNSDYVESIFVADVTPQKLQAVRVSEADYLRITDLIFEMVKGHLSAGEKLIAQGYAAAFDEITKAGVNVEIVDA